MPMLRFEGSLVVTDSDVVDFDKLASGCHMARLPGSLPLALADGHQGCQQAKLLSRTS